MSTRVPVVLVSLAGIVALLGAVSGYSVAADGAGRYAVTSGPSAGGWLLVLLALAWVVLAISSVAALRSLTAIRVVLILLLVPVAVNAVVSLTSSGDIEFLSALQIVLTIGAAVTVRNHAPSTSTAPDRARETVR